MGNREAGLVDGLCSVHEQVEIDRAMREMGANARLAALRTELGIEAPAPAQLGGATAGTPAIEAADAEPAEEAEAGVEAAKAAPRARRKPAS